MSILEKVGLKLLHRFDPERAHSLTIQILRLGLAPLHGRPVTSPRLKIEVGGVSMPNPIGLAAGYDKNAKIYYTDGHEREDVKKDRNECFLGYYYNYKLRCYRFRGYVT